MLPNPPPPGANALGGATITAGANAFGDKRNFGARRLPLWSVGFLLAGILVTAPTFALRAQAAESDRSTPPRANLMPRRARRDPSPRAAPPG